MQIYLETVIAREDHAKEVMLYRLGPRLLERYRDIFRRLYAQDRALTVRRDLWGFALGSIATAALYAAYAWIAVTAVRRIITVGQMTMYVALFRQGQAAVSAMPPPRLPGTDRIVPMLTTGLDGGNSTKSASAMASSTPGAGTAPSAPLAVMASAGAAACIMTHHS